ncbi:hypothetical protein K1X45_07085 [Pseudochrobactrum sp. Wa41.01b-1]|uniref:hypothetical protein n=1 Tax=Pseudochrobactrum sp. Wa41.01b-1 TaxID=2864102 RepID=UPI001C68A2C5|nr:hypothetical protein [Pseudochrobactrum sp. Wa41.01b-1]QYM74137.1 hypothetical protein K1X45_07085 [Pseudochrobactrum sp. Wa41.01b-1]
MNILNPSIHGYLPTGRSIINSSHDQWLHDLFMDKFRFDHNDLNLKYSPSHFEKNLYFVTIHFKTGLFAAKNSYSLYNSRPMFESFKFWYLDTIKTVMGPKANKQIKYQPFAVASLDVEGTAHGVPASVFQTPHIHACLLVHPKNQDSFEAHLLSPKAQQFRDKNISKIDIKQFQDDSRGIEPMLTYASKYAREQQSSPRHTTLLEAYPNMDAKNYPFYRFKGRNSLQNT